MAFRIKTVAALITAAFTAAPAFAGITLPSPPTGKGKIVLDAKNVTPLEIATLQDTANTGEDTLVMLSGDSGGLGNDVSFLTSSAGRKSLFLRNRGFFLDLVQPDSLQLSNDAISPTSGFSLVSVDDTDVTYYIKNKAGILTNGGNFNGGYVGVWFAPGSSAHELNNPGAMDSGMRIPVAVEGNLDTLNNSGYLISTDAGVYISSTGVIGKINNSGDISAYDNGPAYAIYNEGTIKGITGTGFYQNGIYNSETGTIVLNNDDFVNSDVINAGTLTLSDETLAAATVKGNLTNSGNLILNPTSHSAGNTLTVDGNYTGVVGSVVSLGGVLAGDNSLVDRLVITGDTSGETTLNVANENGSGALTLEGIQLITVGGKSDGAFTQGSRIVAGAYDYTLQKGNASGSDDKGWYLTSYAQPSNPGSTVTPSNPGSTVTPSNPGSTVTPSNPGSTFVRQVRPEAAGYAANLQAARSLFNLSLHDRTGETQYRDAATGEIHNTSLWMRNEGGRNQARMADGQNKTTANRYVLQLGGDVTGWTSGSAGKGIIGIMGGYARQHGNTHNNLTGYDAKNSVDGYSAGVYGTWYQNATDKSGLYADGWVQYAWFNNQVQGKDLAAENYKSQGLLASVESGYSWQVADWLSSQGMENSLWMQPHARVAWSGVKADEHVEANGTRVSGTGNDNVQTTLGMRVFLNGKSALDKNTGREFQPFVEANWIYNTENTGVSMNGTEDHIAGTRNVGELKAGVEGKLGRDLSVWTSVGQQMGGKGYSDTQGTLGVKYQF